MPDPHEGTLQGSAYAFPANAVVKHPELLLLGVLTGVGLVVLGPSICATEFYPTRCEGMLRSGGWGLAGLTGVGYGAVRLWRRLRSSRGEQS